MMRAPRLSQRRRSIAPCPSCAWISQYFSQGRPSSDSDRKFSASVGPHFVPAKHQRSDVPCERACRRACRSDINHAPTPRCQIRVPGKRATESLSINAYQTSTYTLPVLLEFKACTIWICLLHTRTLATAPMQPCTTCVRDVLAEHAMRVGSVARPHGDFAKRSPQLASRRFRRMSATWCAQTSPPKGPPKDPRALFVCWYRKRAGEKGDAITLSMFFMTVLPHTFSHVPSDSQHSTACQGESLHCQRELTLDPREEAFL
jgi:hypothetical protein